MGKYKISENAKLDIERIYSRGLRQYGEAQADKYYAAFFDRFEQLTKQPYLYQAVDHIRKGYRRSICGVDNNYYSIENDTILIMAILGQQDTDTVI